MAQLIAPSKAAADSTDQVLIATDKFLLNLSLADTAVASIPDGCTASVMLKTSPGGYVETAVLSAKSPAMLLEGPGTYLIRKKGHADYSFGVDKT